MKQSLFEQRYGEDWKRFETWLDSRDKAGSRRRRRTAERDTSGTAATSIADRDVPAVYRRLCQHLALAQQRQYSPDIVDRLNRLALRGHHVLYGAHRQHGRRLPTFVLFAFPRLVRAEKRFIFAACALFYVPLVLLAIALQYFPDFVHYLVSAEQLAQFEEMYDPANRKLGVRAADTNVAMFAFYIWNNVKIGFQTFATGTAFGIGTLYFLIFNGVAIGTVAGYLTVIGYGAPFWSFVSGHSALELTAIIISGAAGLKLGAAVVAPGLLTRKAALVVAARIAVRLMYGAALMFVAAALIEAFWSPHTALPSSVKYIAGGAMWLVVIAYLVLAGRTQRTHGAA